MCLHLQLVLFPEVSGRALWETRIVDKMSLWPDLDGLILYFDGGADVLNRC